ncbi:cytochrome b [Cupriavidus sp. 30B13]|uniref:cytochrome b n=1 Tax=Cupriavidus sp. 30B13 TaxID=3384241 RepID=UPI003B9218F4
MSAATHGFSVPSRLLHWLMALLILAMLFIGVGMVATVSSRYELLVSIHKPLGVAILVLAAIRLVNRMINPPPPLPATLPPVQRLAAGASHVLLYVLMFAMPLIGWGMLSAAGYPIVLYGQAQLPSILPHNAYLYAALRQAHTVCAFLLFALVVLHFAAALYHGLIRRDGVLQAMTSGRPGR